MYGTFSLLQQGLEVRSHGQLLPVRSVQPVDLRVQDALYRAGPLQPRHPRVLGLAAGGNLPASGCDAARLDEDVTK